MMDVGLNIRRRRQALDLETSEKYITCGLILLIFNGKGNFERFRSADKSDRSGQKSFGPFEEMKDEKPRAPNESTVAWIAL